MTKISSCQSIKFGKDTDVFKVYAGADLVWDSGIVPPVTEFPPSVIYAWDFDVVDQGTPSDVEGNDLMLPKVGGKKLELPVVATLADPFSGIRSGTYEKGATSDDTDADFLPQVRMNSTEWQSVKALSGSFRIDNPNSPNPSFWANGEFLYLSCIQFNSGGINNFKGDILLGFELVTASPPARGTWDLLPTVWRTGDGVGLDWIKANDPYNTVRVVEDEWFSWHAKYDRNNLNLTITNKAGSTARIENISTYWDNLLEKIEFSGSSEKTNGNYFNSGGCSWDNLALHDISFQPNDPQPSTCERYSKYFLPESSPGDDLFTVWDFNQTGTDPANGVSLAFRGCGLGDGMQCDGNGSCEQVAPILPDQYHSCRLNKTLWTPDYGIAADHYGLSYWFTYNNTTTPGVVLGSWLGGNRFLLIIDTVFENPTKPLGTKIRASVYDLFDTVTPEVPVEQHFSPEQSEFTSPTDRYYVHINNSLNLNNGSGQPAIDDTDWYVFMGRASFSYGQPQYIDGYKELHFSSVAVNWDNNLFVSLNDMSQEYIDKLIPFSRPQDITIDKTAFWVNPESMGFDAL